MRILIIGPLGAGKSSLSYAINKKYGLERLNLDEVRRIRNGGYRSEEEQFEILNVFLLLALPVDALKFPNVAIVQSPTNNIFGGTVISSLAFIAPLDR